MGATSSNRRTPTVTRPQTLVSSFLSWLRTHRELSVLAVLLVVGALLLVINREQVERSAPGLYGRATVVSSVAISDVVIAGSLGADGKPTNVTLSFAGPSANVVVYVAYRNAQPKIDTMSISLSASDNSTCPTIALQYSAGSLSCEWENVGAGQRTATIALNRKVVRELSFEVLP